MPPAHNQTKQADRLLATKPDSSIYCRAQAALDGPWGVLTAAERGRVLLKMSALVLAQADELARLEALDVGKPLKQGRADAVALARYPTFYGGAADKVHGETIPFANGYTAFTLREPHGVTAHIVPWNYPMQIIGRSVGAALAMGNACVLKPAEEACLTALAFARMAEAAGIPAGALNVVPGLGEEAGAALASHPGVRHISFTGSVAVGRLIQAAAANNAVPVTLELGGKSPQLVFADADLDAALPFLVNAGIQNCRPDLARRRQPHPGGAAWCSTSVDAAAWPSAIVALRVGLGAGRPGRGAGRSARRQQQIVRGLPGCSCATAACPLPRRRRCRPVWPGAGGSRSRRRWPRRRARPRTGWRRRRSFGPVQALIRVRRRGRRAGDRQRHAPTGWWPGVAGRATAGGQLRHGAAGCSAGRSFIDKCRRGRRHRAAVRRRRALGATGARRASRRCTGSRSLKTVAIKHD